MFRSVPSLFVLATFVALSFCATLQSVANFGTNPTKIQMYIYVPDKLATKPAIIVAVSEPTKDHCLLSIFAIPLANVCLSCTPVAEAVQSGTLVPSSHRTPTRTALFSSTPVHPT